MARRKVDKTMAEIKYSYTRYRRACEAECYHCGGVGWLGVPDEVSGSAQPYSQTNMAAPIVRQ